MSKDRKALGLLLAAVGWSLMVGATRLVAGPDRQGLPLYIVFVVVASIGMAALVHGVSMVAGKRLQWLDRWRDH
jgi:hypothetical protein